ncbi:DNA polymerase III subunit alpha [Maritalea porphyrae]|nr:DNA polymerase III subunit alpha [Maritalea porphyrae]MCZ4273028.1 DNA polymerase III subunit alpha [Maritalea porphyrae]
MMTNGPGFIHLHAHSAYSLLEGAIKLPKLIDLAIADEQPALGIADTSNLFGALQFSTMASSKGLQPIVGCEIPLQFEPPEDIPGKERKKFAKESIVLIAQSETGFEHLSELVSQAYLQSADGLAQLHLDWLDGELTGDLICLSGGLEGGIDPAFAQGYDAVAIERLNALKERFGDRFYIELQRHDIERQQLTEPQLVDYAYANGIPLVATNEPFFAKSDDFESHDALLAVAGGSVVAQTERRKLSQEHYFKSRQEMCDLFADLPEALSSTIEIAERCHFSPQERGPILPNFAAPAHLSADEAVEAEGKELARQAEEGLDRFLAEIGPAEGLTEKDYRDRLAFELNVIVNMKFPGYFLIVADFIKWAKNQGIPVGPGRGSGAGSLVAYSLTITDLDPLRYALLFERFLNPERVSMPDFDIDFCQDRREEVIRYVQQKYGAEQVAQIITFGSLQARAVLRDVGRVLQMPYPQVDRICKLVPSNPANPVTLKEAIDGEPRLQEMRDEEETVADLLAIGQKLEGLYRHASTHAAGIVIGDRPLQQLVPLYRDPRSDMPVSQYNMKVVENAGLVKFDFLGLKTLTVIDYAVKNINRNGGDFSIEKAPLDDELTYSLYAKGETVGVFQVESPGMRRTLLDMKPDRFEDIIALVALYRPGPMDNIPSFCARKHGTEKPDYMHEKLKPILEETFGIIVYQEQVMQLAQVLSGYTLGEADVLRRAMGKKIKSEMDKQKALFVDGAVKQGVNKAQAANIFELVAKFANYGFNKSHAAAYALVSYQTGYLKAHYPKEFLAASMTLDMGNTEKLNDFKREANRLNIEVKPPCVNSSEVHFSVHGEAIHYSLCAVKGVGRNVAEHILAVRGDQPFTDLADFASRIDPKIVNRRTLETLTCAGAFDQMGQRREDVISLVDTIVSSAQRASANRNEGVIDMFSADRPEPIVAAKGIKSWPLSERLAKEFSAIGFYLSAHPLDDHKSLYTEGYVQGWTSFEKAARSGAKAGRLAGTIASRNDRKTRKGSNMSILTLSDPTGTFECLVFSEQLDRFDAQLTAGQSVVLEVEADSQPDGVRLRLINLQSIDKAVARMANKLTLYLENVDGLSSLKNQLTRGGEGQVSVIVMGEDKSKEFEIELPGSYRLSHELASSLKVIPGVEDAKVSVEKAQ